MLSQIMSLVSIAVVIFLYVEDFHEELELHCAVCCKTPRSSPPPPPLIQRHSWDKALHLIDEEVFHLRYKLDRQFLEFSTDVRSL